MVANVARERLAEELERAVENSETTFAKWGEDDCVLWCANILRAGLGIDPVPTIRGKYSDQAGATTLIGKQGLAAGMRRRARKFGWSRVEPARAALGDLGILKDAATGTQTCVLKYRGRFWVARSWHGVAFIPDDKVSSAWSVA